MDWGSGGGVRQLQNNGLTQQKVGDAEGNLQAGPTHGDPEGVLHPPRRARRGPRMGLPSLDQPAEDSLQRKGPPTRCTHPATA